MSKHECVSPGCHRDALFQEPGRRYDAMFLVCKKHVDPTKDGITRIP